jgi:hypothetical protein
VEFLADAVRSGQGVGDGTDSDGTGADLRARDQGSGNARNPLAALEGYRQPAVIQLIIRKVLKINIGVVGGIN